MPQAAQPPPAWIVNIVEFLQPGFYADFIQKLISAVGQNPIRVTSWWRSPEFNRLVSGHPWSQHLVGFAIDLQVLEEDPFRIRKRLEDIGLTAIVEEGHVHVQVFPAGVVAPFLSWLGVSPPS